MGVEGHWTPGSPQPGQPWAGEGCGQEGEGPNCLEGRAALGSPGESPKSEDLQSLRGLGEGGDYHEHPRFGRKASTAASAGYRDTPLEQPPSCLMPLLLTAREVCVLCAPGACHPVFHKDKGPSIWFRVPGAPRTANPWKGLAWALLV